MRPVANPVQIERNRGQPVPQVGHQLKRVQRRTQIIQLEQVKLIVNELGRRLMHQDQLRAHRSQV